MTLSSRPSATLTSPRFVKQLDQLPQKAVERAVRDARDSLLERARENVGSKGPRFLGVRTGALLRSIRTDLKQESSGPTLTLRAARHGWIWQNKQVRPRRWASDAADHTLATFPGFLRQALRREANQTRVTEGGRG